ncbi:MAG: DNA topoisomerase 4 subunit A [Firmicutes bacterium]|nr:DNA topoisomerase 4 subunit A [Bacillota bacterium]
MSDEEKRDGEDHIITNIDEIVKISAKDLAADKEAAEQKEQYKGYGTAKERKRAVYENAKAEEITSEDGSTLILKTLGQVMHESMIPYSEFVIMDRALPRVEDGLKPVQRRILFAMHDMGLLPDRPFRKSAGIVGECLGKYHPHGDSSVYDAMVRLAQPFNMNMPLVLGQGNFGSEDGDPAAAMRYTEAKLSPLALELLRDIDKETVPFSLTFDDRNVEPDILPGRYPNLLTNGATGIAVGLATNIPPHNLGEVIDAHIAYIENPRITLSQVMKIIKGPDFPTGGFVITGEDLLRAYKEGKGKVIMRAKVHIEIEPGDRRNIIITELPYQVNKVTLQKNIADLREQKKGVLQGISEIRDESDRKGMRVVIKIKNGFDPKEIATVLYKYTNLQCNFNINMVAIANGKPRLMGLMQLIQYYCEYQREIIYKRCVFDLNAAKDRAHILEGLLVAIKNIDEVVRIIKTSKHTTEARTRLREAFDLSEKQAQAILDLRLARLTSLEVYKLEQELEELKKLIEKLEKIIASKRLQYAEVKKELLEIKKKHRIERRSRIINSIEEAVITADDDKRPVEDAVLALTAIGTFKRMSSKHFGMSQTDFKGTSPADVNVAIIQTQTDKLLYIFTQVGNCYKVEVGDIPECKLRDKGISLGQLFKGSVEGERAVAMYAITPEQLPGSEGVVGDLSPELVWLSKHGMIKRSTWLESCGILKSNFQCAKLMRDDDEIVRVDEYKTGNTLLFVTSGGMVLNATTADVPVQGRIAGGVKGINLNDGDFCVCSCVAKPHGFIVAVTTKGNVKRVAMSDIEKMVRYRKGLIFGTLDKGENIVYASWVNGAEDLVVQIEGGAIESIPVAKITPTPRPAKYKLMAGKILKVQSAWIHRRKKNN